MGAKGWRFKCGFSVYLVGSWNILLVLAGKTGVVFWACCVMLRKPKAA